jgi:hypothetical protein
VLYLGRAATPKRKQQAEKNRSDDDQDDVDHDTDTVTLRQSRQSPNHCSPVVAVRRVGSHSLGGVVGGASR